MAQEDVEKILIAEPYKWFTYQQLKDRGVTNPSASCMGLLKWKKIEHKLLDYSSKKVAVKWRNRK